jgi:hypothetical protein
MNQTRLTLLLMLIRSSASLAQTDAGVSANSLVIPFYQLTNTNGTGNAASAVSLVQEGTNSGLSVYSNNYSTSMIYPLMYVGALNGRGLQVLNQSASEPALVVENLCPTAGSGSAQCVGQFISVYDGTDLKLIGNPTQALYISQLRPQKAAAFITTTGNGGNAVEVEHNDSDGSTAVSFGLKVTSQRENAGLFISDTLSNSTKNALFAKNLGAGNGLVGQAIQLNGVQGTSYSSTSSGVYGQNLSGSGYGVAGRASVSGTAVYGDLTSASTGYAGYFNGRVHVNGVLSKTAGTFKIDHPQDPANKFLVHSFVESPDMKNIYDGVVLLGINGEACVALPSYFEALNSDYRYQLTPIGAPANLYVSSEVSQNRFCIAGGSAGLKVSWQVTGIRIDAWAVRNRIQVEVPKAPDEAGKYLNPEVFGSTAAIRTGPPEVAGDRSPATTNPQ